MKKEMKEELKLVFQAPSPTRKEKFLQQFHTKQISNFEFLLIQLGYMKKWIIFGSVGVLSLVLLSMRYFPQEQLCMLSAFTPFLAMTFLTENARSYTYKMTEFEMVTRFSLKSIILAKMEILGVFHLLLLISMMLVTHNTVDVSWLRVGLHLVLPYCTSASIGLFLIRKIRSIEAPYISISISSFTSTMAYFVNEYFEGSEISEMVWLLCIVFILELMEIVFESRKLIVQTEHIA